MAERTKQNRSACRMATRVLRKAIKSSIKKFEQQLVSNANTKPFWHYVQLTRKIKASIAPLVKDDDGNLTTNDQECADILSQFYCSVFTNEDHANIAFAIPQTTDELRWMEITPDLVERNLKKTCNFLSAGQDGIPYIVLKNGGQCLIYQLRYVGYINYASTMDILQINGKLLILLLSIKKATRKNQQIIDQSAAQRQYANSWNPVYERLCGSFGLTAV